MQFKSTMSVMIAAALLLAGCGKATVTSATAANENAAQAKSILARTVSVDWLVNELMADQDFNQNGVLDLAKSKNILKPSEGSTGAASSGSIGYEYKFKLFKDADADKDAKVTRDELDKKIRSYDKDGDGKMHARGLLGAAKKEAPGELDALDKDYHLSLLGALFAPLFNK
ncbi:MAG: hypothetical protein JWM80_1763 [Cyanobacteria bacterium RYN_339]|nr:hypothetical protein [Cyanobacteria bacterium RYN_339]